MAFDNRKALEIGLFERRQGAVLSRSAVNASSLMSSAESAASPHRERAGTLESRPQGRSTMAAVNAVIRANGRFLNIPEIDLQALELGLLVGKGIG